MGWCAEGGREVLGFVRFEGMEWGVGSTRWDRGW